MQKFIIVISFIIGMNMFWACSGQLTNYSEMDYTPKISPDYSGITIPPNIAPLNFFIHEKGEEYVIKLSAVENKAMRMTSTNGEVRIPLRKWKKFLEQSKGKDFRIDIWAKRQGHWNKFRPIVNHVAVDSIDRYLVFRSIEPGFEMWKRMGIYQRCLEDFKKTPIMSNDFTELNCMNCHSFSRNSNKSVMFHMRGKYSGTIIYNNGELKKVDTKTDKTISAGVYPAWHPNGRIIAFSTNNIIQCFHAVSNKKNEVIDTASDIILYDVTTDVITESRIIASEDRFETFPCWSPDGKYLYYCCAKALSEDKYDQIRYSLMRIAFDQETCQFGEVDTIVPASQKGMSVSFPRISPDNKYLLFCLSGYGNFTIWHSDSDLYLMNLESKEIIKPDINSSQAESYHTWSSNGRWIVFSSRRIDGLFTRFYFTYFDNDGKAHKPFILPQRSPFFYETYMKSYNIPELVTSAVNLNPRILSKIAKSTPVNVTYQKQE